MLFRGNFPARIDVQGRIKIPRSHRKILEEHFGLDLFVTSLTGDNVRIYPWDEWAQVEAKLLDPPKMQPEKVKFLRNTNYYGQVAPMDRQGRVLVQPHLREAAQINGEVDVIGHLKYLEVWNRERFKILLETSPYTDQDAAVLAELGI